MADLEFNGPFHFKNGVDMKTGEIKNNKELPKLKNPGIYIWGFMFEFSKEEGLLDPIDFSENEIKFNKENMKFIPYYVGLRKDIFKRLKEHQNVRAGNAAKYTRLNHEYLKEFFKEIESSTSENSNFPIHTNKERFKEDIINIIKKDKQKIAYFNNKKALKEIDKSFLLTSCDGKNYPITCQRKADDSPIDDPLYELVDENKMNNFWFCYGKIDGSKLELEAYESDTYFSLKGKTIGHIKKYCEKMACTIINNTETEIFKQMNGDVTSSMKFPGDY